MIKFKDISAIHGYEDFALDIPELHIKDGEFVSLVGPSGAGKSTLLRLMTRELRPIQGEVLIDGVNIAELSHKEIPLLRRKIGTIFQDFKLLSKKNAFENVAFALEVAGRPEEEINDLVMEVLDLVGIPDKGKSFVHQLSGGEKQRVAIARAMVNRPDVIIADEPTSNLDSVNTAGIINLLKKINEMGTTVLVATHAAECSPARSG